METQFINISAAVLYILESLFSCLLLQFVKLVQLYNRPRWQVGHKKIAVQSLGGYFCEGFQRSGSRSRYFSIGVFGGHAAQRSMMSQK